MFENYVLYMASSSTHAFFHYHYAFQKFPFFYVTLRVCVACSAECDSVAFYRACNTQGDTKERELLKCVVAVKECIRGGGRHLQDVIFKH